jgi:hypothetical protein
VRSGWREPVGVTPVDEAGCHHRHCALHAGRAVADGAVAAARRCGRRAAADGLLPLGVVATVGVRRG